MEIHCAVSSIRRASPHRFAALDHQVLFLDELCKEFYGQPSVKFAVAGASLDGLLQDSTF
jgi:hypothetical protein